MCCENSECLSVLCSLISPESCTNFIESSILELSHGKTSCQPLIHLLTYSKSVPPTPLLFTACLENLRKLDSPDVVQVIQLLNLSRVEVEAGLDLVIELLQIDPEKGLRLFKALSLHLSQEYVQVRQICEAFADVIITSDYFRVGLAMSSVLMPYGLIDDLSTRLNFQDLGRSLAVLSSLNFPANVSRPYALEGLISAVPLMRKMALQVLKKIGTEPNFFEVFEALEESQVHIVFPHLQQMTVEDAQLRSVIYIRAFQHESSVKHLAVSVFLRSPPWSYDPRLVRSLFTALNSLIAQDESEGLELWFRSVVQDEREISQVIEILSDINLNAVPSYYVLRSLAKAGTIHVQEQAMAHISICIQNAVKAQSIHLRGELQRLWLQILMNSKVDFTQCIELPLVAFSPAFLVRGTSSWQSAVVLLKSKPPWETLNPRILLLLLDSSCFTSTDFLRVVSPVFDTFRDCDKRPYICPNQLRRDLKFVRLFFQEAQNKFGDPSVRSRVSTLESDMVAFIQTKMKMITLDEMDLVEDIVSVVDYVSEKNLRQIWSSAWTHINSGPPQEHLCLMILAKLHLPINFSSIRSRLDPKTLTHSELLGLSVETKKIGGSIISESIRCVWTLFDRYLRGSSPDSLGDLCPTSVLDHAIQAMNLAGKPAISPVIDVLSQLYYRFVTDDLVRLLKAPFDSCFEHRRSDFFLIGLRKWVKLLHFDMSDCVRPTLLKYCFDLLQLGDSVLGVCNILVHHLVDCSTSVNLTQFSNIISALLVFGPILKSDLRIELKSDIDVRLSALGLLLDKPVGRQDLINLVIYDLIRLDEESLPKDNRYFNDSIVHRRKNRTLQCLLILENETKDEDTIKVLHEWTLKNLLVTSHQPSVKYQLEWLYIRLALHHPHSVKLWSDFNPGLCEKTGVHCSFISIGFHLCKVNRDDEFFEFFFQKLLLGCISQNFTVRLYAQVALEKLWPLFPAVAQKYDFFKILLTTAEHGNIAVNKKKMMSDFYFNDFDPILNFNLKTIFWDVPRLSNLSREEWIEIELCHEYLKSFEDGGPTLSSYSAASWVVKVPLDTCENLQKKFVPHPPESPTIEKKFKGNLIVVTSLITKANNLGGLSRTADVFGVSQLVVGSLSVVKDKNFTSLSMTAEKHIPIIEVKPHCLPEYLVQMKRTGFTLVGAEQTTDSRLLPEFKFPAKTLLLLGNEREGIPPQLLNLLDFSVEIPQFGVIRSLNVHVSGAILMWEYAKAQIVKG